MEAATICRAAVALWRRWCTSDVFLPCLAALHPLQHQEGAAEGVREGTGLERRPHSQVPHGQWWPSLLMHEFSSSQKKKAQTSSVSFSWHKKHLTCISVYLAFIEFVDNIIVVWNVVHQHFWCIYSVMNQKYVASLLMLEIRFIIIVRRLHGPVFHSQFCRLVTLWFVLIVSRLIVEALIGCNCIQFYWLFVIMSSFPGDALISCSCVKVVVIVSCRW